MIAIAGSDANDDKTVAVATASFAVDITTVKVASANAGECSVGV